VACHRSNLGTRTGSRRLQPIERSGRGITTQSLAGTLAPADLVDALVGGGVTTSNVTYVGADVAAGTFSGGLPVLGSFDSGIILSTGDIGSVVGPNEFASVTGQNFELGDPQLTALSGNPTYDAAVLQFDFVPATDIAAFRFVFASDEYQEWANTLYNDVFAFYVNGVNCAVVPNTSTPISVNTINNGNHGGTPPVDPTPHNPGLYRNNDFLFPPPVPLDTEMDGLTVVLTCLTSVNEGVTNHIKLAIADASDDQFDSVVFIQANSFVGSGPGDTDCNSQITSVDALFVLRAAAGLPVTAQCMPNGDVNCSGSLNAVDALLILRFSASLPITGPPEGCPPIGSGPPSPTASPSPSPTPGALQLTVGDNFFDPQQLDVTAGQAFVIDVSNVGSAIHNVHLDGDDDQFDTGDDILSSPDVILGGNSAQVGRIHASPGTYDFRCDFHPDQMTGTITAS